MRLWFGKYNGVELSDIPDSYLMWMCDAMSRESLRDLAHDELKRRQRSTCRTDNMDQIVREIIEAGYRTLAKKYHPDLGGDTRKMQQLNSTIEKLRK